MIRRGKRVTTTGKGRTAQWGIYNGTVTRKRGDSVFVVWDGISIEDEMHISEVKEIPGESDASLAERRGTIIKKME